MQHLYRKKSRWAWAPKRLVRFKTRLWARDAAPPVLIEDIGRRETTTGIAICPKRVRSNLLFVVAANCTTLLMGNQATCCLIASVKGRKPHPTGFRSNLKVKQGLEALPSPIIALRLKV